MAGDANAYGIAQRAIESNDPMQQAVIKSFYNTSCVLKAMPVVTTAEIEKKALRILGGLPTPNWGDINSAPLSWQSTPEALKETVATTRDFIDVDHKYMIDKNQVGGPGALLKRRMEWYLAGYGFEYNYRFIQGRHVNDGTARYNPRSIVGLRERIDNSAYQTNPEMLIDAGALDISATGMTKGTANRLIELMQQAASYTDNSGTDEDGTNCVCYTQDFFRRRFEFALRHLGTDGGWGFVQDPYKNKVAVYRNMKFMDVGRLAPQQNGTQTGRVISVNEKADGTDGVAGTDTFTSFYVVRWGPESIEAWEMEPMKPNDLGIINDGVTYRVVWDYSTGLAQYSTRAISRVKGINMGKL
jgi:hypothetical protein